MWRRIWAAIPMGAAVLLAMEALSAPHALAYPAAARGDVVGFTCGDKMIDPNDSRVVDQGSKRRVSTADTPDRTTVSLETGTSPQYGQVFWAVITGPRNYRKFGMDWTSDSNPNAHPQAVNWNFCGASPDQSGRFPYTYGVEQAGQRWFRVEILDSYGHWAYTDWHFT